MIQSRQVVYKGVDYRNYVMPSFLPPIHAAKFSAKRMSRPSA